MRILAVVVLLEYFIVLTLADSKLPLIGVGTAGLGGQAYSVVCQSLKEGFLLIDTAQADEWYDERGAGLAIGDVNCYKSEEQLRDLFVLTKVHPRSFSSRALTDSLKQSELRLRKPNSPGRVLDAVLLHAPRCYGSSWSCTREQERHTWQDAWRSLQDFKYRRAPANGPQVAVRMIGVSNFDAPLLSELMRIGHRQRSQERHLGRAGDRGEEEGEARPEFMPDIVQNWMDPYHQDADVRRFCARHGVQYMAYSSFGTQWGSRFRQNPVFSSPELNALAEKHNATVAQVVLVWLYQLGVTSIPRSVSREHISANAGVLGRAGEARAAPLFTLSQADMASIEALDGSIGTPWD